MTHNYLYNSINRLTSNSRIIVLFVLSHSVLLTMMLFTFPKINRQLGTEAFDLKTFGYSSLEASEMLQNLDQSTIDLYLFPQLFLLDILYPALLALLLSSLIIRLSKRLNFDHNPIYRNLYILPFIAMIFDYFENIMISIMITNHLNVSVSIIRTASVFTIAKGTFTTISWVIILALFIGWIIHKIKSKEDSKPIQ